jgi:hypothetical protein
MLLLVSVIRHQNSINSYSAISVPLLRRDFLIKASEINREGVEKEMDKIVTFSLKQKKAHKTKSYGLL